MLHLGSDVSQKFMFVKVTKCPFQLLKKTAMMLLSLSANYNSIKTETHLNGDLSNVKKRNDFGKKSFFSS